MLPLIIKILCCKWSPKCNLFPLSLRNYPPHNLLNRASSKDVKHTLINLNVHVTFVMAHELIVIFLKLKFNLIYTYLLRSLYILLILFQFASSWVSVSRIWIASGPEAWLITSGCFSWMTAICSPSLSSWTSIFYKYIAKYEQEPAKR